MGYTAISEIIGSYSDVIIFNAETDKNLPIGNFTQHCKETPEIIERLLDGGLQKVRIKAAPEDTSILRVYTITLYADDFNGSNFVSFSYLLCQAFPDLKYSSDDCAKEMYNIEHERLARAVRTGYAEDVIECDGVDDILRYVFVRQWA